MHFQIGDKISFLNDQGWGIITAISGNTIVVIDENGFNRKVKKSEIVIRNESLYNLSVESEIPTRNNIILGDVYESKKSKQNNTWEIDLHIHELLETEKGLSSGDKLRHQLAVFREKFSLAKKNGIRKLIVIHGVGKGVLKEEIISFLNTQIDIQHNQANFQNYGLGATEITFYQNSRTN